jgi:hypothetical protein
MTTRDDDSVSINSSVSSEDSSLSDVFGSTVAYDDAFSWENRSMPVHSDDEEEGEEEDAHSNCCELDADADEDLASLVQESIRTLASLQHAIAAADATTAAASTTTAATHTDAAINALDRWRCDELCNRHKTAGPSPLVAMATATSADRFSPPISPTSPLDDFAAGQKLSGLMG